MMMKIIALVGFLVTVSFAAVAQVEPAAEGPARPSGSFNYSLHDSENSWWSAQLGNEQSNSASGNLHYESGKARRPLLADYSGGYTFSFSNATYGAGYFQNLNVAQTIAGHKWNLRVFDDISYRPQSPTLGFSGIPGTGEPVTGPPATGTPSETVLTENSHTINNVAGAAFSLPISFSVSFNANANYSILSYPDQTGFDTSALFGGAGLSKRLGARTNIAGEFQESKFTFSGQAVTFRTTSAIATISHAWSRRFTTHFSVGPEWVSSSGISNFPSRTNFSLTAGANYHLRLDTYSLEYFHGDNGGSGVFYGAQFNNINATYTRRIEKTLSFSARFGFQQDTGLQLGSGSTSGLFAGVTAAKRLGKLFSVGANYTASQQTAGTQVTNGNGTVLNGLLQGVSVSIGYAPRGMKNIEQ
jgi:hypothetical protein